jgi:hypothetical protein
VVEADQILSGIGLISNAGGNTARVYNFDVARLTVPARCGDANLV